MKGAAIVKPSEQCKAAGLKSLAVVADMAGVPVQTLINWHRDKPKLFSIVIAGCVAVLAEMKEVGSK